VPTDYKYDVFISYRRQDPDKTFARELLARLEADGYKAAIDERDFEANAHFLEEMERCVKESRFTLAVVSPRFLESGNTNEEMIICKVLDMGERKKRLIPLITEKVEMPVWLYALTGVDYTNTDPTPLILPYDKLKRTLGSP
jgi:hypothetical protein